MRKVLVIGGAGFIGSYLCAKLIKSPPVKVWVLDDLSMGDGLGDLDRTDAVNLIVGDASDPNLVGSILKEASPDVVFHLAANSDIKLSSDNPSIELNNTFGTSVALGVALGQLRSPLPRLVFSSTSAVYGDVSFEIENSTPKAPQSAYGWMKLASERLFESLLSFGLIEKLDIVRFPNVTGKGQTHGVIKDLVAKYLDINNEWKILGDGTQTKPYVHAADLVDAICDLLEKSSAGERLTAVNLSPPDQISVSRIVELIEKRGGLGRAPSFGTSGQGWAGDVNRYSYSQQDVEKFNIVFPSSLNAVSRSIDEEFAASGR